jgi:hypothetical protein
MTMTNNTRSDNYRFTTTNDTAGHDKIAQLRKEISIWNLEEKLKSLKDPNIIRHTAKVDLFGRLGKNNPNAQGYRDSAKKNKNRWFGAGAYQRIAIADAATLDVYVRVIRNR